MEKKTPEIYTTKKGNQFVIDEMFCEVDLKNKIYSILFLPLKSYQEDSDEGMVVIDAPLHEMEVDYTCGATYCPSTGWSQNEYTKIAEADDEAYDLEQGIEWATLDAINELVENY